MTTEFGDELDSGGFEWVEEAGLRRLAATRGTEPADDDEEDEEGEQHGGARLRVCLK